MTNIRQEWFSNIRSDLLAGLVVALALIPEAIAFSIIAGVDPRVGLYASFCIAVVIAFAGGRPGMISAATGAMALLMVTLVREHGLQYLFAATVLTGVLQIIAGWIRLGELMRFVSRSVVTGFVNALAILIFMAQLPELTDVTWQVYVLTASGLAIIYLFPRLPGIGKSIPSPLVCIVSLTAVCILAGVDVRTVGDMGDLPNTLPIFLIPNIPLTLETLLIILPYSVALAVVGLLESLMTATIVDDLTDTQSDRNRECKGQGIANVAAGFFGGMGGCAMIGQSMINVNSGGRGRASGITAAVALLGFILFASGLIEQIPLAALVGVMFIVVIGTFEWSSFRIMNKVPKADAFVIVLVSGVTVATDLAIAVVVGVIVSALVFAWEHAKHVLVERSVDDNGSTVYMVNGPLFFGSVASFLEQFDISNDSSDVIVEFKNSRVADHSAIEAIDTLAERYIAQGKTLHLRHLSQECLTLLEKAGNLVEVNVIEDPDYHIATDKLG